MTMNNNDLIRKIDFGFVLFPQPEVIRKIKELAETVVTALSAVPKMAPLPSIVGSQQRMSVINPHVSVGQYGILGCDIPLLFEIVEKVSRNFSPITEEMKDIPVQGDNTISLESTHINAAVNRKIRELFLNLRTGYFDRIGSRCPINQALYQKSQNWYKNQEEVGLIDQYFQNFGIPEANRMRPHFTLVYNHVSDRESLKKLLSEIQIPTPLKEITFCTLGVVEIDFWGNALKVLYECDLKA